jgi:hypothetical protein
MPRGAETIVVHPVTKATGRFGEKAAAGEDRTIKGCVIWPRGSSETADASNTVVVGLSVLCPPGSIVLATDEITARGERWTVEGEPAQFIKGTRDKGLLVTIKKVNG